jgi:peptidoglycan/xylan/chitin deacetylase (PgdA/CDA1 family)
MTPSLILLSRERCQLPFGHCLLTFDDGPAGVVTEELLLVLREFGVKACFCVVGSQVVARPEQTRAIAADGHLLVNHTFHHRFVDLWDIGRFESDLALCDEAVAYATGAVFRSLPWFRPPFGILTRPVREMARKRRILPITHFAFDTWFSSARTTLPSNWIIKNAKQSGGGIYVLHDGLVGGLAAGVLKLTPFRGWVPQAVKHILESLSACGFQFPEPSKALATLALPGGQG